MRFLQSVALAIALFCVGVTAVEAQTTAIPEAKNFTVGRYLAYGQYLQCAAAAEKIGPDCGGRIYVDPATFPNGSVIWWNTPFRKTATTVPWGYPALSVGRPSGGLPKVIDPAKRLGDIPELPISWSLRMSVMGDASALSDTFLYKDATLKTRALELGVFAIASASARSFALGPLSAPIRTGRFTDPTGRVWLARKTGDYAMYLPEVGDALEFKGDLKWFFDHLQGADIATPSMIYPGTAIGVEPATGGGMLRIDNFSVAAP
jgi:hypothetical protein